ncbi:hypothetical protein C4J81_00005 [Deltaproteobacteria bacterium Smac51]|nr:hypothetical protein C4J81_00005 [Deltaproteobacteria bacterium Smac51]
MSETSVKRRPLKIILIGLAALAALIILIVGGLIIWMRTEAGERFIFNKVASILAGQGFELSAAEFSGPLPGRLYLRDVKFSDKDGLIASIDEAEVRLKLSDLWRGLAHVERIGIESPQLWRLPAFAGSKEDEPSSGGFSLPVDVRLDELAINGGRVHEKALASIGFDNPPLGLGAKGDGRLEKEESAVNLAAALINELSPDHKLINIDIALNREGEDQSESLRVYITVDDGPGGLLAGLMNDQDWPGLELSLGGEGPLTGWAGQLNVSAPTLAEVKADLSFSGATGNLWLDLVSRKEWNARLDAAVSPGSALPSEALKWTGETAKLAVTAAMEGKHFRSAIDARNGWGEPLALTAVATGNLDSGYLGLDAALDGLLPKESVAAAEAANDVSVLRLSSQLTLSGDSQKIESLDISGHGLSVIASGSRGVEDGSLSARLEAAVIKDSLWLAEGRKLAGLAREDFGGDLKLGADLNWNGADKVIDGKLDLVAEKLHWPEVSLDQFLGPTISVAATVNGGGGKPYSAVIEKISAKEFQLKGEGQYDPAEAADQSRLEADLTAEVLNLASLAPSVSGPLSLKVKGDGTLGDLKASIDLSSPGLTTPSGVLDSIDLNLTAAGRLMTATPAIKVDTEDAGKTTTESVAVMAPDMGGDLVLKVAASPGGPLNLSTGWHFTQAGEGGGLLAKITDLKGALAGLDLSGGLTADLRGEHPALDGSLKAEMADWSKLAALIGQPLSGGPTRLEAKLSSEDGRQSASADLDLPSLRLAGAEGDTLSLGRTTGVFLAVDLFGQADLDADLTIGSGAAAGAAKWSGGRVKAQGRTGYGTFSADVNGVQLSGFGGSGQDGLHLAGDYNLNEMSVDVNRLDLSLAGSGLKLNRPVQVSFADNLVVSPLSITMVPSGSLTAEADLTPGRLKVKADLAALPFSFFQPFAGADTAIPQGQISSLAVDMNQGPGGVTGALNLAAAMNYQGLNPSVKVEANLSGGASPVLSVNGDISGGSGWDSNGKITASLPLAAGADGGFPQADMNAPITASLDWSGAIGPVWKLANQPDRSLLGVAAVNAKVGGTLAKPEPQGSVYVAGGRYEDIILGVLINDITLEAHSTPDALLTAVLSAKDSRGGGLAMEGKVNDAAEGLQLDASGRLGHFNPLHRDDLSLFMTGDITAKGPLEQPTVTSDVTLDRGELDLKVLMASQSIPTLKIANDGEMTSVHGGPRLNMKISVPNQFFIRGYGLDSEWEGTMTVSGFSTMPSLTGRLEPVRGYFEIFSREFQFTGGDISFNGGTNPNLNLELTNNGPNITAVIRIGGNGTAPTLHMTSQPPLPEEEVLAQVLFGKNASSLSRFEAIQLAASLRELTNFGEGGFSFDPVTSVRKELGLDVLRIGSGDDANERAISDMTGSMAQDITGASSNGNDAGVGGTTVEAGKYISDKVYVGVEHSPSGGSAFRVEMELSPRMSLEARTSTESSQVGIGWKKDY